MPTFSRYGVRNVLKHVRIQGNPALHGDNDPAPPPYICARRRVTMSSPFILYGCVLFIHPNMTVFVFL